MKLYYHPASTTCRPIMLLAAAEKIELDYQLVDLFTGENYQPAFTAINPNQTVPLLVDDDFQLAESSAILKYLAEKVRAPSYPAELRARARVNERMDWFNTGLYRDLGYGLVYPQVLDSYRRGDDQAHGQHLAWSRASKHWLEFSTATSSAARPVRLRRQSLWPTSWAYATSARRRDSTRYSAYPNIRAGSPT
jgi:glutathione S-transferase